MGGWKILAEHPEDILRVEMNTDTVLVDIDTPEDYIIHLRPINK